MSTMNQKWLVALLSTAAIAGCAQGDDAPATEEPTAEAQQAFLWPTNKPNKARINYGSNNLHLSNEVRFLALQPNTDSDNGRAKFGIATDGVSEDPTDALFEGFSAAAGGQAIVSNGRSCFTCHRPDDGLGLPVPPLSNTIPFTDPVFTGVDADAQGDPDGLSNIDDHALFKYRPNRFNPTRPQSDPYRKVFFWRKSPRLINVAFSHGFLNDGRGRNTFETARGAIFAHTQQGDERFDDLFDPADLRDMEAFMFEQVSDPVLNALRDPQDPMHNTLVNNPFATVDIQTFPQWLGSQVFKSKCMNCHSTPNVFNSLANTNPVGSRNTDTDPAFGPGQAGEFFNIGVSEKNTHNLRFTEWTGSGYAPIVLPMAAPNGDIVQHTVTFDIGLAATTARTADIGKFKVPQLRDLADNAPYFHDNSALTIEEALDHHLSAAYANSPGGQQYPIWMSPIQRHWLLQFLNVL